MTLDRFRSQPDRDAKLSVVAGFCRRASVAAGFLLPQVFYRGERMMMHPQFLIKLALAWCCMTVSCVAEENVLLLEDFDDGVKLSKRWTAMGRIAVTRTEAAEENSVEGVGGMLAECDAQPQSKFLVNRTFQRPAYERYDTIRFRLRAKNANAENPLAFEFQVFSQERPATLWRKFAVATDQWQTLELPMQHFRYSNGAVVRWDEVNRFGIHFRDASKVSLDGFELVAKEPSANPYFTPKEVGEFAFGEKLLSSENEHFVVLTDDPRVDRQKTLTELEHLYDMVFADFPKFRRPSRKVPVVIFSQKKAYEQFWSKLGSLFVSQVPPVRSSGYSLLGVSGTYYSDEYGSVRPVLIHEACHSLLATPLGLSNGSEWLHEGLTNYYQLNWTKQDVHALNRERIESGGHRPFRELLNGKKIGMKNYAQATLVVKWLLEDDHRKQQLFAAMKEMRRRTSTQLEPICEKYFDRTIDELELDWLRWAQAQH